MDKELHRLWAREYQRQAAEGSDAQWPAEPLIRMFKGAYIPGMDREHQGKSVLEVGFGPGANLAFLGGLGLELHGLEVEEDICRRVRGRLDRLGLQADIVTGTQRDIPFPDNRFDYLVSWNVIHYETSEADILAALAEQQRVLKPGGRVFFSTTGPDHAVLRGAEPLGGHCFRIKRADDFRRGRVMFCFETPEYARRCFERYFQSVLLGRVYDDMFTDTLDWFLVTGVKPLS
jgi:ubiquinone/menaquinone biosynthesis C-methylase UbiE